MELTFMEDIASAKRLDEIVNSYSGRDQGTVMADVYSLTVTLFLLAHRKIAVTEYTYSYDRDIQNDSGMMEIYSELARETNWRQFQHTEIERIRIHALRQTRQMGKPFYDGDFVCYQEGRICVHCGNLTLPHLLLYLASHERMERFYVFTYPYWTEDHTAKYYRFDLSDTAVKGARIYQDAAWEKVRRASESSGVFPKIPLQEDDPVSSL